MPHGGEVDPSDLGEKGEGSFRQAPLPHSRDEHSSLSLWEQKEQERREEKRRRNRLRTSRATRCNLTRTEQQKQLLAQVISSYE